MFNVAGHATSLQTLDHCDRYRLFDPPATKKKNFFWKEKNSCKFWWKIEDPTIFNLVFWLETKELSEVVELQDFYLFLYSRNDNVLWILINLMPTSIILHPQIFYVVSTHNHYPTEMVDFMSNPSKYLRRMPWGYWM